MPASRTRPERTRAVRKKQAKKRGAARAKPRKPARLFKAEALAAHAREIQRRLAAKYPDAHCELEHRDPLELAVATILSAQCTDKRVNLVTPGVFARFPDAAALASAATADLEPIVRSTGFFRSKAKSIIGMARALVARHGGRVPRTMDELVALPGIGRKTANVILGNAFAVNDGIVVDTHVMRLSGRMGFTRHTDPVKVERALMPLFPRDSWTMLSHLLIWHGRRVCDARKPKCPECVLKDICPSALTNG